MKKNKVMLIVSIILSSLSSLLFSFLVIGFIYLLNFDLPEWNTEGADYSLMYILAIFLYFFVIFIAGVYIISLIVLNALLIPSIIMLSINIAKNYQKKACIILLSIDVFMAVSSLILFFI